MVTGVVVAISGASVVASATVAGGAMAGGAVTAAVTDLGGAVLLQLAMANATAAVPSTRCNEQRRRAEPGDSRSDLSKSGGLIESLRCRSGDGMPESVLTPRTVAAMLDLRAQVRCGVRGGVV